MVTKDPCRFVVMAALLLALGGFTGCSGPDNPKLAKAPPYTPPKDPGPPPEIQGRKEAYGSNPKYQEIMEKRAAQRR